MLPSKPFWSLHTHSEHSANDALSKVGQIVQRAHELGYPALGLTDHRSVSGSIQLYTSCRKIGIEPLPGIELDVFPDRETSGQKGKLHLTVAAYNEQGYRNLVKMATLTAKNFWYKPRIDFADIADMSEHGLTQGLVVSTGCFFGVVPQIMLKRGHKAAVHMAEALAGWFPTAYVELQNHGVEQQREEYGDITDDEVLDGVWDVAQSAGLPVIIGRDSHYVYEHEQEEHDALKRLVAFSEDPDEAVFPGSGYFMTDTKGLKRYYPPHMLEAGLDGLDELANKAYVRLPELETFTLRMPPIPVDDPQAEMEALANAKLKEYGLDTDQRYVEWLRAEYDTIRAGGFAAYLLIVKMVCDFMREKGIRFRARGSACASLVLWLFDMGVPMDPVTLELRFDRFLSRRRTKPPDVDLDVEHLRRDEVVAYLQSLWAVRPIGNQAKYSLTETDSEGDHSRGSLKVRFFSTLRKQGVENREWRDIPTADKQMLFKIADRRLFSGYGRHAAGQIVAPNETELAQMPLAYIASSKQLVTAYAKKDVEKLGFLKLDLLGLRTMSAIADMEAETGMSIDDIQHGDKATYRMIAAGKTNGVFQLDGYTMRLGMKELRPRGLEDLIVAQALYRPAPLQSGMKLDYIARRRGREQPPERHEDIMTITAKTHGVLAYQEQVMDVLTVLGLDQVELEEMLDAVKASNEYTIGAAESIAGMMPRIEALAKERGWTGLDIAWLVEGLGAYADYSFNRAHAAAYADLAYRLAWMKCHYKLPFWKGTINAYVDDDKKLKPLAMDARRDGVRFLPAHVNKSGVYFTIDASGEAIRRGLMSIKGISIGYAPLIAATAPYSSYEDLGERVASKVTGSKALALGKSPAEAGGAMKALYDGNALEGLTHRR